MKKIFFILLISTITQGAFAQSKPGEVDLNNIKRFYTRLKSMNIDTKQVLLWKYTYGDTVETSLKKLALVFEKENLKTEEIKRSTKKPNSFTLTVSEQKVYKKPELLNDRVEYLNSIAHIYKICNEDAVIGAEKQKKETGIDSYKKIGKENKEKE